MKVLDDVVFQIADCKTGKLQVVHVDRLKPVTVLPDSLRPTDQPSAAQTGVSYSALPPELAPVPATYEPQIEYLDGLVQLPQPRYNFRQRSTPNYAPRYKD